MVVNLQDPYSANGSGSESDPQHWSWEPLSIFGWERSYLTSQRYNLRDYRYRIFILECWPWLDFDISLNKYFLLGRLLAGRKLSVWCIIALAANLLRIIRLCRFLSTEISNPFQLAKGEALILSLSHFLSLSHSPIVRRRRTSSGPSWRSEMLTFSSVRAGPLFSSSRWRSSTYCPTQRSSSSWPGLAMLPSWWSPRSTSTHSAMFLTHCRQVPAG